MVSGISAAVVVCFALITQCIGGNPNPVIGILTLPMQECRPSNVHIPSWANGCFESTYVKWLEQSGARVVPVLWDSTPQQLDDVIMNINGILFTGGGLDLGPHLQYYRTAQYIFEKAISQTNQGDWFPMWGTCQGFQLLSILAANDTSVLETGYVGMYPLMMKLNVTDKARGSKLLGGAPQDIWDVLTTTNSTVNWHHDGIPPEKYTGKLGGFFTVTSTNEDLAGKAFASTMEAPNRPYYATQWHPEKPQTEFTTPKLGHAEGTLKASEYVSRFFVEETRKSAHYYPDKALDSALVGNYERFYTGGNMEVYFFPASNATR
eukprot:NODE_2080_length_1142_cov_245.410837_g2063_i0.p1 GENE.NODE_2080_length_1142_cov_245.410837_g2063_i0~~NODE_2080_length_1142_cov_245.410837_g2063_i0.p1  ORF type:complete len:320 (+),score=57.22 NODE_2080_length_1142_cov_245.410837_g2063_i0:80-1039(+)